MTSISPAQPRPPPSLNILARPSSHRIQETALPSPQASVKREDGGPEGTSLDFADDRPTKRRKVSIASGPTTTWSGLAEGRNEDGVNGQRVKYTGASWIQVVASQRQYEVSTDGREVDAAQQLPVLPLPERPWPSIQTRSVSTLEEGRPGCRVRKNIAVPTTPDAIDTPEDAPLLEDKRRADYFPWTGKHPEDVLSDIAVKNGFWDRPPNPGEKELNTGKTSIYNALKHRAGLESLSALFSLVLEQKSSYGAYTTPSTFRGPPPRVTLTEVKRKSWIADLSNPDVPLRRLSKTIPQGIRGQSLLEQCLQHFVPLSRAIWFTKCVGANEIRTLKRKGINPTVAIGAEAKWLKEWTANIEQFIDQILSQCGQSNWKERIRYAIQLATRLYAANLMDRDHYLDWIVKTFTASNMSQWPFWLMIVNLHGADLLAYRKRGRQVAEMMVTKLNVARRHQAAVIDPLVQRLARTTRTLASLRPGCFLIPDRWNECEKALQGCLSLQLPHEQSLFRYLKQINLKAMGVGRSDTDWDTSSPERVVEILDEVCAPIDFQALLRTLDEACSDRDMLMMTCVQWCTSKYRTGLMRIYIVTRLFRKWHRRGFDVDEILLNFIFNERKRSSLDVSAYRHLFSELSRSHTFSASKYLQWLVVRGMSSTNSFSKASSPILVQPGGRATFLETSGDRFQLLTELCLVNLDDHVCHMRSAVLARAGFDEGNETQALVRYQAYLGPRITNPKNVHSDSSCVVDYDQFHWSMRTQLSHWLRSCMIELVNSAQVDSMKPPPQLQDGIWSLRFAVVRDALEKLQDIAVLADVLRIAAVLKQEDLLASIVDTINFHAESFSAIGALEPLQHLLGLSYTNLRPVRTSMPLLATSLIDLCQRFPVSGACVRALQREFVRGDNSRANAACSPFSDGIAESLQQAGETFYDDFEAILQTESNMNEQTMTRLFNVLVTRIEKLQTSGSSDEHIFSLCQLLCRLKLCRNSQGDNLLRKWLTGLFGLSNGIRSYQSLLARLVGTHCVQLDTLLEVAQETPLNTAVKRQLQDFIRTTISPNAIDDVLLDPLQYVLRLAGSHLVKVKPAAVLELLVIGNNFRGPQDVDVDIVASLISNPDTIKSLSRPAGVVLSQKLTEILGEVQSSNAIVDQVKALADGAGPLSMPFVQFRLRILCQNASVKSDEKMQEDVASVLQAAIDDRNSLLFNSPGSIQAILRAVGPNIGGKIKSKVEQNFFQALPKFIQSKSVSGFPLPSPEDTDQAIHALHRVAAVNMDSGTGQTASISLLIEKFSIYLRCLGSSSNASSGNNAATPQVQSPTATMSNPPFSTSTPDYTCAFLLSTLDTLSVLMQMVCIKRSGFSPSQSQLSPVAAKQSQQDQIKLLSLIITIATHPAWMIAFSVNTTALMQSKAKEMTDFMFDVAATLVDEMAEESRMFCARFLKEKLKFDDRVKWLVGSVNMFGSVQCSDMAGVNNPATGNVGAECGSSLQIWSETKGVTTDFKPKIWELLESGGGGTGGLASSNDGCLSLGLFAAKRG